LEAALGKRGVSAEVINGGVEGYGPVNLLYEIERYKALRPEIVTIYIGWNAIFSQTPWAEAVDNRLRLVWLFRSAIRVLQHRLDPQVRAKTLIDRVPLPDPDSPAVKSLAVYEPPFMEKIERFVDEIASTGSKVALVTLPGLFTLKDMPTPHHLRIGYLPEFTENPFVLAMLTSRYNDSLRRLAKRKNLLVVDLAAWGDRALRPKDVFFTDAVHLNDRGLEMIGAFMAEQLIDQVKESQAAMSRRAN
jgi:hypothetical protein